MAYIFCSESPESIGEGRTAYGVSYRRDQTNWVAQVDEALDREHEITKEEYEAYVASNEEWENQNPGPEPEVAIEEPAKPTLEDVLAVLPPEIMTALNTRLLEKSQEITLSDNVS